jgi:Tripartite tricarboxylate transporter TctB family
MQVRNKRDFWSGVMFAGIGLLFMVLSRQYTLGTAAKMGPGYFPTMLGGILVVLGLLIALPALRAKGEATEISKVGWREIVLVLLGVILFAALLPKMGMVVALIVLLVVAALASHEFKFRDTIISIIVLSLLSYGVFVKGLELQFPVWPKFLTQ